MGRRAVNGRVVVEEVKEDVHEKSAGGILLPMSRKKALVKGVVSMADKQLKKVVIQGETVYYRPNTGLKIDLDGKEYTVLRATELELVES